jgi:hypothetical protein
MGLSAKAPDGSIVSMQTTIAVMTSLRRHVVAWATKYFILCSVLVFPMAARAHTAGQWCSVRVSVEDPLISSHFVPGSGKPGEPTRSPRRSIF